jgi:hypothetical protein
MSEAATDNQMTTGQTDKMNTTQQPAATDPSLAKELVEATYLREQPTAQVGTARGETAREVAAQHFARLMYSPASTWSRYVFHENDPHPFGNKRSGRGRR